MTEVWIGNLSKQPHASETTTSSPWCSSLNKTNAGCVKDIKHIKGETEIECNTEKRATNMTGSKIWASRQNGVRSAACTQIWSEDFSNLNLFNL